MIRSQKRLLRRKQRQQQQQQPIFKIPEKIKNESILTDPGLIGASSGINIVPSNIDHDLILKMHENPDVNFSRGIIPKAPNERFLKILIGTTALGASYLARKYTETTGSLITNRIYNIGGQQMVSSLYDMIGNGVYNVGSALQNAPGALAGALSGVPGALSGALSGVSDSLSGIPGVLSGAVTGFFQARANAAGNGAAGNGAGGAFGQRWF